MKSKILNISLIIFIAAGSLWSIASFLETPFSKVGLAQRSRTDSRYSRGLRRRSFTVMTYNILTDSNRKFPWSSRRNDVAEMIRRAHVVGVQEASPAQINDLQYLLQDSYELVRGDRSGKDGGEFVSIFYLKDRFEKFGQDTFWLSETPHRAGSQSWNSRYPRIVTWIHLYDRISKRDFFVFNTHFDHMSGTARQNSAYLLTYYIDHYAGNEPALVMGDFNIYSDGSGEPTELAYSILLDSLDNTAVLASKSSPWTTTHCKEFVSTNNRLRCKTPKLLDYIFVSFDIEVWQNEVLKYDDNGIFPSGYEPISDHFPVIAEISLPPR